MEEIMAHVDDMTFDIERQIEQQVGALPLPFNGMDKSGAAICVFNLKGSCDKGQSCPYRHTEGDRTVVCKHWLRGLCKKGDKCEFLHEFDMTKMPECFFYSRFNACTNKECTFQHIDPGSKKRDCPWYDRGFCRHGPNCRHRHTLRVMCVNYLVGFCPLGPECKHVHPRFDLPGALGQFNMNSTHLYNNNMMGQNQHHHPHQNQHQHPHQHMHQHQHHQHPSTINKNNVNVPLTDPPNTPQHSYHNQYQSQHHNQFNQGQQHQNHFQNNQHHNQFPSPHRNQMPNQQQMQDPNLIQSPGETTHPNQQGDPRFKTFKPMNQVTCFKCGHKGHYANRCPKGYHAFLSLCK